MEVKVIGPIKEYLKTFNTPDEFNLWYAKNKDEIDKITTHKLNKMYYIEGYRITKIKGVLCLKKAVKKQVDDSQNDLDLRDPQGKARPQIDRENESAILDIQNEIEQLKSDILAIKTAINDIVKAINGE